MADTKAYGQRWLAGYKSFHHEAWITKGNACTTSSKIDLHVMYKLPDNFDPSLFIGRTLAMICFNANQIYLHFENDITITIEGGFFFQETEQVVKLKVPVLSSDLMQMIERRVKLVKDLGDATLQIIFEDNSTFVCYNDPNYESYRIEYGGSTIIV